MVVKIARRRFLKFSLLGGVGFTGLTAFWLAVSQHRAARWLRTIIADSRRKILPAPSKANPAAWPDNGVTICWLGHATVLINFYGIRLLLDPALDGRVGINVGIGTAGPKRYVAPALQLRELPPIDVLLLTHAHMVHID